MQRLRAALAKQSGIPIARLLKEQDARIPQALPETPRRLSPPQPRQPWPQHRTQRTTQPNPATDGVQDAVIAAQAAPTLPTRRRHALS